MMPVTILFNNFAKIAQEMYEGLGDGVTKTAKSIASTYSATAARDTGAMADSSYTVTTKENTYGQVAQPTHKDAYLLPCVDTPSDDVTAMAAVAMNYAVYPELGTRFQAAQPAFYPAVDQAGTEFVQNLVDGVASKIGGS
jgi:hypothetical protein